MASPDAPARISKIAGRYLVFDPSAASFLRRSHHINGLLVGTTPQQPTQNMFLGMPIELRSEEVGALVSAGAAFVVDDAAAHREMLHGHGSGGGSEYVEALRRRKMVAQRAIAEQKALKAKEAASRHKKERQKAKAKTPADGSVATAPDEDGEVSIFEGNALQKQDKSTQQVEAPSAQLAVTPTSSDDLIPPGTFARHTLSRAPDGPLCRLLQRTGYFMTPGLRFGSQYSAYPGDPLRFHAHFMANEYGWDEPIPTLEIVEGGRLATAVKKAFLIGGNGDGGEDGDEVRTFSIEWAAM